MTVEKSLGGGPKASRGRVMKHHAGQFFGSIGRETKGMAVDAGKYLKNKGSELKNKLSRKKGGPKHAKPSAARSSATRASDKHLKTAKAPAASAGRNKARSNAGGSTVARSAR